MFEMSTGLTFMLMVFVAVVTLAASLIVPTVGTEAQASKRMRRRIDSVLEAIDSESAALLHSRYLNELSPVERSMESLPGMEALRGIVTQSGIEKPAYAVIGYCISSGIFVATVAFLATQNVLIGAACGLIALTFPIIWVLRKRAIRLSRFEEQLPEALDMMARALEAGHPFNETLKMVGEEMPAPISGEFARVFTDINYGLPTKTAFISLLSRVPSVSLNTLVTAVLIQNESGGRLAEILHKISAVIRGRFKLQRKVKTLSAEGRLSAWILTLLPFVLTIIISLTTPSYLPRMINDPMGMNLVYIAFTLVICGILWMRKIIRFKY